MLTLKYMIIFILLKFQKFVKPNKCIYYKGIYLNISYDFLNFDGSSKIKV